MESYKFWKLTGTLGVNYSRGNLGDARFTSLSSLGGVVGNFNLGKKMSTTTMFVMVTHLMFISMKGCGINRDYLLSHLLQLITD